MKLVVILSISLEWLIIFFLLVEKTTQQTNEEECFADSTKGSTESSCGTKSKPCKIFAGCFGEKNGYSKVVVSGRLEVDRNINVKRSVTIIGHNKATIKGRNAKGLTFIGTSLKIINIRFDGLKVLVERGIVTAIENCIFTKGHLRITNIQVATIKGSLFFENTVEGALHLGNMKHVTVQNCAFFGNYGVEGGAIHVSAVSSVIYNCSFFNNSAHKGGAIRFWPKIKKSTILISQCDFRRNKAMDLTRNTRGATIGGAVFGLGRHSSPLVSASIKNCLFEENTAYQKFLTHSDKGGATAWEGMQVSFEECLFRSNKAAIGGAVFIELQGPEGAEIFSSRFHHNEAKTGGAMTINTRYSSRNGEYSDKKIILEKNTMVNNSAEFGGAIYIGFVSRDKLSSKIIEVTNCRFLNNSATTIGQSIYSNEHIKLMNIYLQSFEKGNAYHVHLETGARNLALHNVTIDLLRSKRSMVDSKINGMYISSISIKVYAGLRLLCPQGFNVGHKISYHLIGEGRPYFDTSFLTIDCSACPYDTYSLNRGAFFIPQLLYSRITPDEKNTNCSKCNIGGICDVDIKAVDNYWGYRHSNSRVSFKICPERFCCSSDTVPCDSYNTCAIGRKGTLCGECDQGFKQSFVTGDCIRTDGVKCNAEVFIVYLVIHTFVYTVTFICITNAKDIISGIKDAVSSKCKGTQGGDNIDNDTSGVSNDTDDEPVNDGFSIAAFVQITVLHLQVASLLKVKFVDGTYKKNTNDDIFDSLSRVFNFRFSVYQQVCPSDDLTLPRKEMILFGMKLATFGYLLVIGILITAFNKILKLVAKPKKVPSKSQQIEAVEATPRIPSNTNDVERISLVNGDDSGAEVGCNGNQEVRGELTLVHRVQITFIKLIKMYYTPVTKAALQMVHCIEILGTYHLFVYGSLVCYTPWQICILVVLLPGILLFPIAFEMALRLLKKNEIGSTCFTVSIACPYFAILMYVWKLKPGKGEVCEFVQSPEERAFASTVLAGEHDLFVESDHSIGWQIVQFYRTFVINLLTIFLVNPLYRSLAFGAVLLAFIIHDRYRQPYKNNFLNNMQPLSSRCLLLILLCNVIPSVSFMLNATSIPDVKIVVQVLSIVELTLYALVPLSLPLWKVWGKLIVSNIKKAKCQ